MRIAGTIIVVFTIGLTLISLSFESPVNSNVQYESDKDFSSICRDIRGKKSKFSFQVCVSQILIIKFIILVCFMAKINSVLEIRNITLAVTWDSKDLLNVTIPTRLCQVHRTVRKLHIEGCAVLEDLSLEHFNLQFGITYRVAVENLGRLRFRFGWLTIGFKGIQYNFHRNEQEDDDDNDY